MGRFSWRGARDLIVAAVAVALPILGMGTISQIRHQGRLDRSAQAHEARMRKLDAAHEARSQRVKAAGQARYEKESAHIDELYDQLETNVDARETTSENRPATRTGTKEIREVISGEKDLSDYDFVTQSELFKGMNREQTLQTLQKYGPEFSRNSGWMVQDAFLSRLQPDDIRGLLTNGYLTINGDTHAFVTRTVVAERVLTSNQLREYMEGGQISLTEESTSHSSKCEVPRRFTEALTHEDLSALVEGGTIEFSKTDGSFNNHLKEALGPETVASLKEAGLLTVDPAPAPSRGSDVCR